MYGGENELAMSKVENKTVERSIPSIYSSVQTNQNTSRILQINRLWWLFHQRVRQKSNITLKSKSTTLHGYHALLYIASSSEFPFRKRSLPFLRHLENVWTVTEKKDDRNPGSNPDRLITQNLWLLSPLLSSRSRCVRCFNTVWRGHTDIFQ